MKEYRYRDVKSITKERILFKDGFKLFLEECKNEWCIEHNINTSESYCVAERDCIAEKPYFIFYSRNKVRILFDRKGIFAKKRNRNEFRKLQLTLKKIGYSSYDMT